jgi:uncharacterized membrane protein YcaP (DUF421 family)
MHWGDLFQFTVSPLELVLRATLVYWFLLDWAAFRWPWLQKMIEPPPLLLVEHGRLRRHAMRREMIGVEIITLVTRRRVK